MTQSKVLMWLIAGYEVGIRRRSKSPYITLLTPKTTRLRVIILYLLSHKTGHCAMHRHNCIGGDSVIQLATLLR